MGRFDNYAQQLSKVSLKGETSLDPASDTMIMSSINGFAIAAALSQDLSNRTIFELLSSPNTQITVSSNFARDLRSFHYTAVVHQCMINCGSTAAGTPGAAADMMVAANEKGNSVSIIDNTSFTDPVLVLSVGSLSTTSSVSAVCNVIGSGSVVSSYVTRSSANVRSGMTSINFSRVK